MYGKRPRWQIQGLLLKCVTNILHLYYLNHRKRRNFSLTDTKSNDLLTSFRPDLCVLQTEEGLVLYLHLDWSPSPFISLLLSIYWIRKPYSRKKTFNRTQHQHFQYSDVWFCRPPYSIPWKYLWTWWGTTQTPSLTAPSMESVIGLWEYILCFNLDGKTELRIYKSVFEIGEPSQCWAF